MDDSRNEQFLNRALQKRLLTRSQTDSLRRELKRRLSNGGNVAVEAVAVEVGFLDSASAKSIVGELTPPPQGGDFAGFDDPKAKLQKIAEETGIPTGTPPPAAPLEMEHLPPLQRSGDSLFEESEAISELAKGDPTDSTRSADGMNVVVEEDNNDERGFTMPPPASPPAKKRPTDVQTKQVPAVQRDIRRPSEIVEDEPGFDQGFTMPPPADDDATSRAREKGDAETNRVKREPPKKPTELVDMEPNSDRGFTLGPPLPKEKDTSNVVTEKALVTTAGSKTTAQGQSKKPVTERQSFDTTDVEKAGAVIDASEMTVAQLRTKMSLGTGVDVGGGKGATGFAGLSKQTQTARRRYVVVREIARGGMGKVLEVEDTDLRRSVALKVLRKELVDRRDLVERFLEEAQITGQLEHPNIVPVHEIGIDGKGNLYFTMKLVEGWGLNEILNKLRAGDKDTLREWTISRLLEMFLKLCEGIAFAHSRGVIHRDLKPANIMVGRFGEVQIMDWGVSKIVARNEKDAHEKAVISDRMESEFGATMVGAIVGTPSYMSPEQAKGETDALGVESDIFALGVILYELLSLRSPWTGKTSDEVLEQVRTFDPEPPSRRNLDRAIAPELDDLALRCLAKSRDKRLATVRELMVNIRNYMEGRTMAAVKYSIGQLLGKWMSRNKRMVLTSLLVVVALIVSAAGTVFYLQQKELERIPQLISEGNTARDKSKDAQSKGDFKAARDFLIEARTAFDRALKIDPENEEAKSGTDDVSARFSQALLAEHDYQQRAGRESRFKQRLDEVRSLYQQAKMGTQDGAQLDKFHAKLARVLNMLDLLLDEDEKNAEALSLKANIALHFGRRALVEKEVAFAELLYTIGVSTGLSQDEFGELDAGIKVAKTRK
ncbi:MAG: serine/threonine protein kinase [Planctomycetes bacterium]|nr:serine/threonine protein kinase [Planctomycetota bacterium]